jgi:hypothetical protein
MLPVYVKCNLVIGQRIIYMLRAGMCSRLDSAFMAIFFIGGAVISAKTQFVAHPLLVG